MKSRILFVGRDRMECTETFNKSGIVSNGNEIMTCTASKFGSELYFALKDRRFIDAVVFSLRDMKNPGSGLFWKNADLLRSYNEIAKGQGFPVKGIILAASGEAWKVLDKAAGTRFKLPGNIIRIGHPFSAREMQSACMNIVDRASRAFSPRFVKPVGFQLVL